MLDILLHTKKWRSCSCSFTWETMCRVEKLDMAGGGVDQTNENIYIYCR